MPSNLPEHFAASSTAKAISSEFLTSTLYTQSLGIYPVIISDCSSEKTVP